MKSKNKWIGVAISSGIVFGLATFLLFKNNLFPGIPFLNSVKAASLQLILESNRPIIQQPFQVTVLADSSDKAVNVVGIYLHFDPQKLQLLDIDTRSSFCQFYPEKKFDNRLGTINISCGSPHPGFKGNNTLIVLKFMPTQVGKTQLKVDPQSQLLASDGKGTNILSHYPTLDVPIFTGL
jgi:hypothetical protein